MRLLDTARQRRQWTFGLLVTLAAIVLVCGRDPRPVVARGDAPGGSDLLDKAADSKSSISAQARSLLDRERLSADDLTSFGEALLKRGQTTLGWSALVAAIRIQPGHPGAMARIAALHLEMERMESVVNQVDRLTAVPGGPVLAELVLGLAAFGSGVTTSPAFDVTLDRILNRTRSQLLKVTDIGAARKLLARVLLEEGRGAQALALLERLSGEVNDPEKHWLLSRVYLARGQNELAVTELNLAGSFGNDTPMEPEPSPYVGAARCSECHAQIYRRQQNSHHAKTITHTTGLASVPLPPGPIPDPQDPKVWHAFHREGDKIEVTAKMDDKVAKAIVDYAIGSGNHGVTMLARDASGHRSLRISYYTDSHAWGLTNPIGSRPTSPEGFIGDVLSENLFRSCLGCHTTRFDSELHPNRPEAADKGIGCERCHGPGDAHVKSMDSKFPQIAIAQPKIASHADRAALCAQCHQAQGGIPPSDPRFIRFQSSTLAYSRCVTESAGRLDCITCHDPHTNVETRPAHYEAKCLGCHSGKSSGGQARTAVDDDTVAAPVCPVNPRANCIECHMPKSKNSVDGTPFTDHHIRIHQSRKSPANDSPRR